MLARFWLTTIMPLAAFAQQATTGPSAMLSQKLTIAPVIDSYAPCWWSIELSMAADPPANLEVLTLLMSHEPLTSLRDVRSNKTVSPFSTVPHWIRRGGELALRPDLIEVSQSRRFKKKYLLNQTYGNLPPGEYELTVRAYLTTTLEIARMLPGREAPEIGTISSSSVPLVIWELPKERATFRIHESAPGQVEEVLSEISERAKRAGFNHLGMTDWLTLVQLNSKPAWNLIIPHLEAAPAIAKDMASLYLLNECGMEEAVERAKILLMSENVSVNRIGLEVIEQRGRPEDALILRENLRRGNSRVRREAYYALSRVLNKPTDPSLGTRRFKDNDAEIALSWLDELEAKVEEEDSPTTRPHTDRFELTIPTQSATRPSDTSVTQPAEGSARQPSR